MATEITERGARRRDEKTRVFAQIVARMGRQRAACVNNLGDHAYRYGDLVSPVGQAAQDAYTDTIEGTSPDAPIIRRMLRKKIPEHTIKLVIALEKIHRKPTEVWRQEILRLHAKINLGNEAILAIATLIDSAEIAVRPEKVPRDQRPRQEAAAVSADFS